MKIAVISDVHGNFHALDAIYKDIKNESVDSVVFLGDLIMSGPNPVECYELMDNISPDIWLKGNTDDVFDSTKDYIPKNKYEQIRKEMRLWAIDKINSKQKQHLINLPISTDLKYGNVKINYCHGSPKSYSKAIMPNRDSNWLENEFNDSKSNFIICGHSHLRFSMLWKSFLIKNFGSVSLPNNDCSKTAKYGIINISDNISFIDKDITYNFNQYIEDMKKLKFPGILNIFLNMD